jgi:hypothetical protein
MRKQRPNKKAFFSFFRKNGGVFRDLARYLLHFLQLPPSVADIFSSLALSHFFIYELPRVIAYAISRGFKGILSDSWGFTSPISGLVRITYISEQIGSLSSHHTSDVL